MSDLNKDIEILKEFTESNFCLYGQEEIIEATKNVLSDRETWEKIAEKLAELLLKGDEVDYICDMILDEHCDIYKTGECTKCIIDWARNEVENE